MSDMYKWLAVIEEGNTVPFRQGETVQISKDYGGGVGEFVNYMPGSNRCTVNVKGDLQEFTLQDLSPVVDPATSYYDGNTEEQRYNEIEHGHHELQDKPELQPGATVVIDGIYGAGNGPGYGVFVAYALDGNSAICNVDSVESSYPITIISAAPEDGADETFASTGNDGALSPMSFGDENRLEIKHEEEPQMEDLEKWMKVVEEGPDADEAVEALEEEKDCGCGSYDCKDCFPSKSGGDDGGDIGESVIGENEIFDQVIELGETVEDDEDEELAEEADCDDEEEIDEEADCETEEEELDEGGWASSEADGSELERRDIENNWASKDDEWDAEDAEYLDDFAGEEQEEWDPEIDELLSLAGLGENDSPFTKSGIAEESSTYTMADIEAVMTDERWSLAQRGAIYDYMANNPDVEFDIEELDQIASRINEEESSTYTMADIEAVMTDERWSLAQRGAIYDYMANNPDVEFDIEELDQIASRINEEEPEDEFAVDGDVTVDVGDDMGQIDPDAMREPAAPMGTSDGTDVDDLIAKIQYMQDMGISMSDRHFDPEKLWAMQPDLIKRIHAKVVGEDVAEAKSDVPNDPPQAMPSKPSKSQYSVDEIEPEEIGHDAYKKDGKLPEAVTESADPEVMQAMKSLFG